MQSIFPTEPIMRSRLLVLIMVRSVYYLYIN